MRSAVRVRVASASSAARRDSAAAIFPFPEDGKVGGVGGDQRLILEVSVAGRGAASRRPAATATEVSVVRIRARRAGRRRRPGRRRSVGLSPPPCRSRVRQIFGQQRLLAASCPHQAASTRATRVSASARATLACCGRARGQIDHHRHRDAGQQEHDDDERRWPDRRWPTSRKAGRRTGSAPGPASTAATIAGSSPPIKAVATTIAIMIVVSKDSGLVPDDHPQDPTRATVPSTAKA